MTNTANTIYDHADLARAAYADFPDGVLLNTADFLAELENADMTASQAEAFAIRWPTIVEQFEDPMSGVSATLFRNDDNVC